MLPAGGVYGRAQSLMTRHVREVVLNGQAQLVGRLPATQIMQVDIVLPLRDKAGLDAFVADVYDPSSPNFRHFLTPAETSARFGPTQENWDALVSFANANGFTVVGGSLARRDLVLTGTVSAIENAFHVTMRTYQHPTENRTFYLAGPRTHCGIPFQSGTYLRPGQLLDSASAVRQAEATMRRHMASTLRRSSPMPPPAPARRLLSWAATCARPTTEERL